ncbi:hypothetical protein N7468_009757 [Penicillium chermesinum]|uniref:Kinesin-like protein n=1 Tax=Penicillium chermesinum TaxID=63820 RepID=A0A9W9NL09_9EURO|nr:uncharacterized protein N7468_009757 [Penicillium chermesinum]KAJ5220553.1 hypothetical protein N7468_009757 [Penicillium chermesinum]
MASAGSNTIKVVARFRPQNKVELSSGGTPIVEFESEESCRINSKEGTGTFTFDRVFPMDSLQADIFDFSIRPTVDDILQGYNGTVFAYGQTGAGKSYTMMGSDIDDEAGKGVIPRIVEQIFANILTSPSSMEYTVRVSYMEIYMERIRDLLVPQNDNLPVHEEKARGVYVKGLLEVYVSSVQEVYEVMRRGGNARAVAATNMNQESSRSHSIFVITVAQKNLETGSSKSGQLFLVDLAGSEKVGKTGASGQTLEEAKKINKSLSALGMVINALTDGKSSHIPYRDSKLTRILQESLGGNSRTTLIINASPSSYNDAETISTLRFGVRAKAIKNKAKVNAELSPAELKILLRKAQTQVTNFETYISALESEVNTWRGGESVPKEQWTPARSSELRRRPGCRRPLEPKPLGLTPDLENGPAPPSLVLEKDEREEFLRRENELQDQLAEKETHIANVERSLREAREELKSIKGDAGRSGKDNERLNTEVNELRMQLEKVSYEGKEAAITMDGLREANAELTSELDEVKQQLLDVRMRAKETTAALDEKEKKKAEKMAKMMAGFDLGGDVFSDNERKLQDLIQRVDALHEISSAGEPIAPDDLTMNDRGDFSELQDSRRAELEKRLDEVQREYEGLLSRNLGEADVEEIRERLEKSFISRKDAETAAVEELRTQIARKDEELTKLRQSLVDTESRTSTNGAASKTLHQQIAEFDAMKKSLMRDLQNRCERVVELEISLDDAREQYNNVLRSSNNRAQQKKMAFLERNLEQLTHVQRQLVEQNSSLKKEVAIAERKLIARNERIASLEGLLQESQEKLTQANHRFEAQLTAVKERLEAAKQGSTRGLPAMDGNGSFSFGGSRIAKPLRGGGGSDGPTNVNIAGVQSQETASKRSSWFSNRK